MSKVGNETRADMAGAGQELGGNTRRGPTSGAGSKVGNETKADMGGAGSMGSSAGSSVVGITGLKHAVGHLKADHARGTSHMPLHGMKPTGSW
jgi:hypothetical protein